MHRGYFPCGVDRHPTSVNCEGDLNIDPGRREKSFKCFGVNFLGERWQFHRINIALGSHGLKYLNHDRIICSIHPNEPM